MSLLSLFLRSHLVPALESAFISHTPELQAALVNEVETLGNKLLDWVDTKIKPKDNTGD